MEQRTELLYRSISIERVDLPVEHYHQIEYACVSVHLSHHKPGKPPKIKEAEDAGSSYLQEQREVANCT